MLLARVHRAFLSGSDPARSRLPARHLVLAAIAALTIWGLSCAAAFAADSSVYQVRPGDTLTGIAARHGVSVAELVSLNGLANPDRLLVGQVLIVGSGRVAVRATTPAGPTPLIQAPYVRQFDGSVYADSNCGPASLAMALGAVGIGSDPISLRHLAARQMGFDNPGGGTTWDALVFAAGSSGAKVADLRAGRQYRVWSIDDLRREFALGHPVILLVRYRSLPDHQNSAYWGDHYIVGLGFDRAGNLIYDDPAFRTGSGADRTISPDVLMRAWSSTSVRLTRTAMAIAP